MKSPNDREQLIEAVAGAWRATADGSVRTHPSWYDLDEAGREDAFEAARVLRSLEAALDADGLSTTAHAVLARIRRSVR